MANDPVSLSMITFFFNEEEDLPGYLETVTGKFAKAAARRPFHWEIVLVDDGSTDRSGQIVTAFIADHPRWKIHLRAYQPNRGIGHALVEGIQCCRNEYVFWNDVDLHFDLLDLDRILPLLTPQTVVVAYKDRVFYKQFVPWFVSRTNYYLLKMMFFPRIRDFQFVQFYPRHFLQHTPIVSRSSLIPCELLTRVRQAGLRIAQVPLHYHSPQHRRQSKCMNLQNIFFTFRDIFKLRLMLWR
jgi:glycosyltransferase involved in cell wall biosynthesis